MWIHTLISKNLQRIQRYVDTYIDTQTFTEDTEICADTLIRKHLQRIQRYVDTYIDIQTLTEDIWIH